MEKQFKIISIFILTVFTLFLIEVIYLAVFLARL